MNTIGSASIRIEIAWIIGAEPMNIHCLKPYHIIFLKCNLKS